MGNSFERPASTPTPDQEERAALRERLSSLHDQISAMRDIAETRSMMTPQQIKKLEAEYEEVKKKYAQSGGDLNEFRF